MILDAPERRKWREKEEIDAPSYDFRNHVSPEELCTKFPSNLREFMQLLAVVCTMCVRVFVCQWRDFTSDQCSCACTLLVIQLNTHQENYFIVRAKRFSYESDSKWVSVSVRAKVWNWDIHKYDFGNELSTNRRMLNVCHLSESQSQNNCTSYVRICLCGLRAWQQFLHFFFINASFFSSLCFSIIFFLSSFMNCSDIFSDAKKRKIDFGRDARLFFVPLSFFRLLDA